MELWIRSQDKSSIVKVDNLYVSVGNYICYYVEKGKEVPGTYYRPSGGLGRYETKERALEVLDEIQSLLQPTIEYKPIVQEEYNPSYKYKHFVKVDDNIEIKELSTFVYQMPEK